MTLGLSCALRVLYLFAGAERKAALPSCLRALTEEFNKSADFDFAVDLQCIEIDILRGGKDHDLSVKARRDALLQQVLDREFDIAISTPPCSNHTRALFANAQGPKPTRDFYHPRGFPRLTPAERTKTDLANTLVDFSLEVLSAAADVGAIGFLEFPEDLGATARGVPASLWQLPSAKALSDKGHHRVPFTKMNGRTWTF